MLIKQRTRTWLKRQKKNGLLSVRRMVVEWALFLIGFKTRGFFSFYANRSSAHVKGDYDGSFTTLDGRSIPVYKNYRYSVKLGWQWFSAMNILNFLDHTGCLNDSERAFFQSAKGVRTIAVSPTEMRDVAKQAIEKNKHLFSDSIKDSQGFPVILPRHEESRAIVQHYKKQHASMFRQLRNAGIYHAPSGGNILEIGFISGGHSIFGFEQLGFRAHGVDNHYGGVVGAGGLHVVNAGILGRAADFRFGDITGNAPFDQEEMDIIFSASVLEHIQNLKVAFVEMHRILKPGGAMIHNFAPYFSHDGGHALGIPDSPWAHTRMDEDNYTRYLKELRPLEEDISVAWYLKGLNRGMPLTEVQKWVVHAGFEIRLWMAKPSPQSHLRDLTPEIIRESFIAFPHISLNDLATRSVSFVAIKR